MVDTLSDTMHTWYASQLGHDGAIIELEREYFGAATNETWADVALRFYSAANGSSPAGSINDEAWKYYSSRSGLSPAASYSLADHMYAIFGSGSGHAVISPITDNLELFLDAAAPDGYQTDARVSKNLLTFNQTTAEDGVTTGFETIVNSGIANTAAQAKSGTRSLQITSVAGGTMTAGTTIATGVAVVVGNTYTAVASFRSAVSARGCQVRIQWFNSVDGSLGTTDGSAVNDTTTGWVNCFVTGAAPANAVKARVICQVVATGGASEVHYVDEIGIWLGTSTDWVMPGKLQNINLLTTNQATVETDTTGLFAAQNCTIARAVGAPVQGIASLLIASAAAGDFQAGTTQAASGIPVVAGKTYTGVLHAYAPTVTRSARARIVWYKSDGSLTASGNTIDGTAAALSTSWVQRTVTGVAPVDAAFAALRIYVIGAVAASEFVYIDQLGLWEGYSTSWVPPYRGIGTNGIQDGDPVPFLYDLSGKGRHASQATVASQPLYRKYDTAVSKNMLTQNQASAETDTTGFTARGNTTIARNTTQFVHGAACIAATSVAAGGYGVNTTTTLGAVPVLPNTVYTIVVQMKAATVSRTVSVSINWWDAAGGFITGPGTNYTSLTTEWVLGTHTATSPSNAAFASLAIAPTTSGGAGEVHYFDNFGLWAGSSTNWIAPDKPVRNLLTYNQASVETDTTGLTARGSGVSIVRSTAQFTHGTASVAVTNPGTGISADWGVAPTGSGPSSSIPITAGTTYTFHAKVKAEAATGTIRIYLMWRNAAGSIISENSYVITTPTTGWDKLVTTQVAPALAVGVTMAISRGTSSITYWVDELGIWEGSRTIWQPPVTLGNNKPTIQWAYGQSGSLELLNGIVLPPTATTIYVITKLDATGYSHTPRILAIGGGFFIGLSSAGPFGRPALAWTANPIDNNVPTSFSVLSFKMGASASEIRYNGVLGAGTAAAASGVNTATWDIGSSTLAAGGGVIPGTISAILVYSAAHTDTQRQQIERWLGGRFGVTVA